MNVVVFAPYAVNTPHFETELEIAQRHLDDGDSVTFLVCGGELAACDVNLSHAKHQCLRCIARRTEGLKLLSPSIATVPLLAQADPGPAASERPRTEFSTIEELQAYHYGGFDVGYAALSSAIFRHHDPDLDVVAHRELLGRLINASCAVFDAMTHYLNTHRVDRVYLYNGRFAPLRAVLRACQQVGVDCYTHEKGRDLQHFTLYHNTMPHDREYVEAQVRGAWLAAGATREAVAIADRWYRQRAEKDDQGRISFVRDQQQQKLPDNWDSRRTNVTIFTSSEHEFTAIGDSWRNPLYANQVAGARAIIESLRERPGDLQLYIRMHPNLRGVDNRQTREMARLDAPFLTVLAPHDPVCTYTLMRESDKVVSFGSTAGIEASYWGTPSILAGMSYYRNLGGTYNPVVHEELVVRLREQLSPKAKNAAWMYGHYFATEGQPFQYYHGEEICRGTFKGKHIRPRLVDRIAIRATKGLDRLRRSAA